MPKDELVKVTQADRAKAERFNCDLRCNMTGTQVANLAGAFARHRLAAIAAARPAIVEECAKVAEGYRSPFPDAERIATAIRAIAWGEG